MDNNFSPDKPIALIEEDRFQRYNFSERIAKTIIGRQSEDCIVIGIYGAWGEGKTSVINFIETELNKDKHIIIIKFNPWRFSDENALLMQFFHKLAKALNANLKTKREQAGAFLKRYSKLFNIDLPLVGNVGESIESAGEMLDQEDIEILKDRIGEIIKENERKIVVFIDDIDRLDKTEIHSIFRLVKLTADFSNTTYILSFDERMVASAIGERFGEGNQKAGQSFLEKIIQVPLKIPVAQKDALQRFCFDLINNVLRSYNINFEEEEGQRFALQFSNCILLKLDTPRLAVRYGNTLSFSIPLLFGEVNTIDLMLIEALKVFYPEFYELVKHNPDFFIGSYTGHFAHGKDNEKIKQIKDHFEELSKSLTRGQFTAIQALLEELFPRLKEAFKNYSHGSGSENEWLKNQRIGSTGYFNRYFSYAVIKGEISDIAFKNLIRAILGQEEIETIAAIEELVKQSSVDNFLIKLGSLEETFSSDISIRLAKAITKCAGLFLKKESSINSFSSSSQAAILITNLIKKHDKNLGGIDLAKELVASSESFQFACILFKWLTIGRNDKEKIFANPEEKELFDVLLKKALGEAGERSLFEKYPEEAYFVYRNWAVFGKEKLKEHIEEILQKDYRFCLKLLNLYTPTYRTGNSEAYQTNFSKREYTNFVSVFDKELIKKYILMNFSEDEINRSAINWDEDNGTYQNDLNIIRQFLYWDKENSETSTEDLKV